MHVGGPSLLSAAVGWAWASRVTNCAVLCCAEVCIGSGGDIWLKAPPERQWPCCREKHAWILHLATPSVASLR